CAPRDRVPCSRGVHPRLPLAPSREPPSALWRRPRHSRVRRAGDASALHGGEPVSALSAALRARLVHDVGKHVARTARNVPDGRIAPPLVALLRKDLYRTDGARRGSRVFAELCGSIDPREDPRLARVAACFDEIDSIEDAVARSDEDALRRAV